MEKNEHFSRETNTFLKKRILKSVLMVSKQISNYDFLIEFEFKMQILNFCAHYNGCEI